MTEVRYYCPRCEAIATLDRDAYLADKCVTPHPLDGWEYADAYEEFEDADGVEIVCGGPETEGEGCGEVYYLSFVKYDDGEEVEPRQVSEFRPPSPSIPSEESDEGPRFDFEP
ncbi:hypothetical protein NGM10_13625 [Halorussus salilacus]|uniref:hypothetical protein n=1 Tax=Halorussus salilacus TaxID=2953750 RepID=UPI0020A0815A|nr:hypothetical protein [Halorussus salilacus]USZ67762.1 hypothetical protein NGM10_13625 [Halorussus salilacus]